MVKYHKTFGKIEVLNSNEKTTLIKVSATGQEKKCSTGLLMNLISDTPFSDDQINEGSLIINSSKKIDLTLIHNLAKNHNLRVVNYQGDFISLNFPNKTPKFQNITDFGVGVMADFVSEKECANWRLTDGVSFEEIKNLQNFFKDLENA